MDPWRAAAALTLSDADTMGMWNPVDPRAQQDPDFAGGVGEQALDLPGEEPARLTANRFGLIALWVMALLVTGAYIGMPLTMFLIPVLGNSIPAVAVAVCTVVVGSLAVRIILRAILTERVRS